MEPLLNVVPTPNAVEVPPVTTIDDIAALAAEQGYDIVDLEGFLAGFATRSDAQKKQLSLVQKGGTELTTANAEMETRIRTLLPETAELLDAIQTSLTGAEDTIAQTGSLAKWVTSIADRMSQVEDAVRAVRNSNNEIAAIATQVNILAINAKIEAARAGDAGKGFAVVAEAINALSRKTSGAAKGISGNVIALRHWVDGLREATDDVSETAETVQQRSSRALDELGSVASHITKTSTALADIAETASKANATIQEFSPHFGEINSIIETNSDAIGQAYTKVERLVDRSEIIVQKTVILGGTDDDQPFIEMVQSMAKQAALVFTEGLAKGILTEEDLFTSDLVVVPGTAPEQFTCAYLDFTDEVLPDIIDGVLEWNPRVIFACPIQANGYIPTHNTKFSAPQTSDVVWNTANSRHRRIFDDRVGLKAGRNTEPFLVQVYRRDMGNGDYRVMKDVSAPIFVNGRHWGGLRLAYTF